MKKKGVDVLFLQETHMTGKRALKLKKNGFNQVFSSSYKSGRRQGLCLLISNQISVTKLKIIKEKNVWIHFGSGTIGR